MATEDNKPAPLTINLTQPINMTVNFPDGASVSLYVPNCSGRQADEVKARLKAVIDSL